MQTLNNSLTVLLSTLSDLSPILIAIFTWLNYKMYKEIQKKDENYKKETADLYQALVIATLLSGPSSYGAYGGCKEVFLKEYKGETKIFKG